VPHPSAVHLWVLFFAENNHAGRRAVGGEIEKKCHVSQPSVGYALADAACVGELNHALIGALTPANRHAAIATRA
jgi:hypothetical protein